MCQLEFKNEQFELSLMRYKINKRDFIGLVKVNLYFDSPSYFNYNQSLYQLAFTIWLPIY